MKCSLCGYQFREKEGATACHGCPLAGTCHMIKCPNCGYEIPMEPKLIKTIKGWRKQGNGTGRKG